MKRSVTWFLAAVASVCLGISLTVFLFVVAVSFSHMTIFELLLQAMPKGYILGSNILVVGIDDTRGARRSDTLMVVHVHPDGKRIGIVSIPRDCKVNIPGVGVTKINAAYAYGGVNLVNETVSQFLRIPLHYYVLLRLQGVQQLVDDVGGVVVDVDKSMHYTDRAGKLFINLKPGKQRINGREAVGYVRFRHDANGDVGRMGRQQEFLHAMAERLRETGLLAKLPFLVDRFGQYIETNMNTQEMLSLGLQMSQAYHAGLIQSSALPGAATLESGASYYRIDPVGAQQVIDHVLFGFAEQAAASPGKGWVHEAAQPLTFSSGSSYAKSDILSNEEQQIDISRYISELETLPANVILPTELNRGIWVLNGGGAAGSAGQMAQCLRDQRVSVANIADAPRKDFTRSLIKCGNNHNDILTALYLARFLVLDPYRDVVIKGPLGGQVQLIIGQDWELLKTKFDQGEVLLPK